MTSPRFEVPAPSLVLAVAAAASFLTGCATGESQVVQPRNADPSVEFVGPRACAECHPSIAASYSRTGMGRSLYRPDADPRPEDFEDRNFLDLPDEGIRYEMTRREGDRWMRQIVVGEGGKEIASFERRIDYVLGSGNHSRSYITVVDGAMYQMPVCWYPDKPGWDLCPGYEFRNRHFTREADESCLHCHNARAALVDGTTNKYEGELPHGIDCERCHGPGALHVARWKDPEAMTEGPDDTIANPAKLPSPRRIHVCFQCHLGDADASERVFRQGTSFRDYRPGDDLTEFMDLLTFEKPAENRFGLGGQGDRLVLSRCYTGSAGELDCLTCHNPHVTVYGDERPADAFRKACLQCHGVAACSVPEGSRRETTPEDDCVVCHMRKSEPADQRFTRFTDHWIRRRIDPPGPPAEGRESVKLAGLFEEERKEFPWGEAHMNTGRALLTMKTGNVNGNQINWEAPAFFLRKAVTQNPRLAEAWFLLGKTAREAGNRTEAIGDFRRALEIEPGHRFARLNLASTLLEMDRPAEAEALLEPLATGDRVDMPALTDMGRARVMQGDEEGGEKWILESVRHSVLHATPLANLGLLRARQGRHAEAIEALLAAGSREPALPEIWAALVRSSLEAGRRETGLAAARQLVRIRPRSASARILLGRILAAQGDRDAAARAYNRALELSPGSPEATQGLEELGLPAS